MSYYVLATGDNACGPKHMFNYFSVNFTLNNQNNWLFTQLVLTLNINEVIMKLEITNENKMIGATQTVKQKIMTNLTINNPAYEEAIKRDR